MTVKLIAIGASAGGVKALSELFSCLPANFSVPIAVVIHRSPVGFDYLLESLQKQSVIKVQEALDKLPITSSTITVAPADYHLLVDCGHYALSADASVAYARPSIDVLMESVADQYSDSALGIILTGGGYDGVKGLQKIQSNGGAILVQNPKTAQDSVLPQAIIDHGITQKTFDLEPLSKALLLQCRA